MGGPVSFSGPQHIKFVDAPLHACVSSWIKLQPLFDQSLTMRAYWKNWVHTDALARMAPFIGTESVVHATVADPLRPFANAA